MRAGEAFLVGYGRTRAKGGYILVKRYDKHGNVVEAKDHGVPSAGMHTAEEMEHIMRDIAEEVGASEDQIRIETYNEGEAPIDYNPRRSIPAHMWFRGERRRIWGGWSGKDI